MTDPQRCSLGSAPGPDARKPGDRVPDVSFRLRRGADWVETSTGRIFDGRNVIVFSLPGAFTPTCSAKHVPGYVAQFDALRGAGVDEIWCLSVNDAFVMGAWARDQKTAGKVRMLGDGSAAFTQAVGLPLDLTANGMGVRSQRYSMLVVDGVVRTLNIEAPGKFEVSDADTMLTQAKALKG